MPAGVALLLGLLLAPRRAQPQAIPVPLADPRAMAQTAALDHQLAEQARGEPLPGPVRALGSAIRDFHALEAKAADARAMVEARRALDSALIDALAGGPDALLRLRAVQLEGFVAEVSRLATTGAQSEELQSLAGDFVRSMKSEGYSDGRSVAPPAPVLRVMFKLMWNTTLGFGARSDRPDNRDLPGAPRREPLRGALEPSLDEQRTLYAFYLSHPQPSKAAREALDSARRGAKDAKACEALVEAERAATEARRLERIARLAAIDSAYPADYARGVVRFRQGEYAASAAAFRKWLSDHPEGPLALRAQNYLREAAGAESVE